jgi:glycosyltransferase involved in cell wall biosynthesis
MAFNLPQIMPRLAQPAVCLFFNEHREWLPAGPPKPGQVFAFPAKWMRNVFLKATDLDPACCLTIPMGINLKAFSHRRITDRRNDKMTLLFSSVWHPGKGIEEFLETCSMLSSRNVNFRALLTGSTKLWDFGDQQERVFSEAERNRIESLVRRAEKQLPQLEVLGEIPHTRMPEIFRSADLLLVPSRWSECLPLVVIEAMASGTPALSAASGGLPELIVDGVTGYLVHTASASVLTDAVEGLIKSGGVPEEMRKSAREAVRHLSWSRVIRQLERAISLAQRT